MIAKKKKQLTKEFKHGILNELPLKKLTTR